MAKGKPEDTTPAPGPGKVRKTPPRPQGLRTISDLQPDPDNPREIKEENAAGLTESLREYGDLAGITFNIKTGQLVTGHQRVGQLTAAHGKELRIQEDKEGRHYLEDPVTFERFYVREVAWDQRKQRGGNITANNPHIAGHFTKALQPQLQDARERLGAMYKALQLNRLELPTKEGKTEADDIPKPRKVVRTKPGDLYLLGPHRLLCGDSTKAEDVVRLMGTERAGLMNTDPPYGIAYDNTDRPGVAKKSKTAAVANDSLADEKLQAFLESAFRAATASALTPKAAWYLWHAHLTQGFFAAAAAAAANVVLSRQIIWVKPVLLLSRGQYHWKHEPCFFGWVKGNQPPDYGLGKGERTQTTVWEVNSVTRQERKEWNHSTPKPVKLFEIPIVKHLKEGEICYEPFAGTGPQFIAAEMHGRRCFGLELDPQFCDVIVDRWEAFSGQKAKVRHG